MNIIFLDIDGVLNCINTKTRLRGFLFIDDDKIERLAHIIEATNAKIVLTSTWRIGRERGVNKQDFLSLEAKLQEHNIAIFDCTPIEEDGIRGHEITSWLTAHNNININNFIILDDDNDMDIWLDHLVQTDFAIGLQEEHITKAINMLNIKFNWKERI